MGEDTQHKTKRSGGVLNPEIRREFSSGGVVYKTLDGKTLWLVRKTTASKLYPKQYWMLPKGRIDDSDNDLPGPMARGEKKADEGSLQKAAIREVREEGGIDAKIIKKIGTSIYSFTDKNVGKILKFVTFYLMEYVKDHPDGHDWETEEVVWLSFEESKKLLSFGGEKDMLQKANDILASTL